MLEGFWYIATESRNVESISNRGYAASYTAGCRTGSIPGYHPAKIARSSSFSTRVRTWSCRCASRGVHPICCFLTMRVLITWVTVDSTNAVQTVSP